MASLSIGTDGSRRVSFTGLDGKRATIHLSKGTTVKACERYKGNLERLLEARTLGEPLDRLTSEWVAGLSDAHHAKLAKHELVQPREAAAVVTLADLVRRFVEHADVKTSTRLVYKQGTDSLIRFFGAAEPLDRITPARADDWRKSIASECAPATQAKRAIVARQLFRKAVRWQMLNSSPFAEVRTGSQANETRCVYVPREVVAKIIAGCADHQWRAVFGLTRYAALRCPSELRLLRWCDVNFESNRLVVRSPKTEHHGQGHATRIVPIDTDLRAILLNVFHDATEGVEWVLPRLRDPGVNLRTSGHRHILAAGHKPWERLYQNLRASCATDWCEAFPNHCAAAWCGHSPTIAAKHYLQTRDDHFDRAAAMGTGAKSGAPVAQNPAQHTTATDSTQPHNRAQLVEGEADMHGGAVSRTYPHNDLIGVTGLEPVTSPM
jgi:integrase